MLEKSGNWLSRLFIICFALAIGIVLFGNGACMAVVCMLFAMWLCRRRIPHFTLWLFIAAFAVRLFSVFWLHPPEVSDFKLMYDAAQNLIRGDTSYLNSSYFQVWAYQNAFVIWESLFLRIWDHPVMLRLVNALLSAGTICLIYRIALRYGKEENAAGFSAAQMVGVLVALFPFGAVLPGILTNQIAAAFFLCLGVWLLISRECQKLYSWRFVLAGLVLQIGNLLRPEGVIVLVGILAWKMFQFFQEPKAFRKILWELFLLFAVYFAVGFTADALVRISGLSPNGFNNMNPLWKFVVGLNTESKGCYSTEDAALIEATYRNNMVTEETIRLEKEIIRERLQLSFSEWITLLRDKIQIQWGDHALYWTFSKTGFISSQAYSSLKQFDRAWFYLASGISLYGLIGNERKADRLLSYCIVFAAFAAFLVIEVQSRYAYMPQLFLFLSTFFGFQKIFQRTEKSYQQK